MKSRLLLAGAVTGAILLSVPSQADPLSVKTTGPAFTGPGKGSTSVDKTNKSIEGSSGTSSVNPGGQSGGIKSGSFNPPGGTFPSPTASGQAKVVPAKIGASKSLTGMTTRTNGDVSVTKNRDGGRRR